MAVEPQQMVTVDGVRYDPEDAPKKNQKADEADTKERKPANKSRTASNK